MLNHQPTVPASLNSDWRLLGYDVADEHALSGLMNCGYTPQEKPSLAATYAPHLNAFGLFDDPKLADAYVLVSDERVEEHRPFYRYALYVKREMTEPISS